MVKITELRGNAQVFSLKDGTTFRIFARETRSVAENKISDEMQIAENMGLIAINTEAPEKEKDTVADKPKKTGGAK